jgi:hypothetical protein
MTIPIVRKANPLFGHPVPRSTGVSQAYWARSTISPYPQKGGGWAIILNGGVQTGANWAAAYFPTDEVLVSDFNYAQWSYYMTGTETMGVNIVFIAHDPDDFDNRVEITQLGGHADLPKTAGYNAFKFTPDAGGIFFYGENTTGTGLTAGTQYTWSQFQSDVLFKNWKISRISLESGWEASGTFDPIWLTEVKLNGLQVPLIPTKEDLEAPVYQYTTATSGALAVTLAPKTPFRLLRVDVKVNTAPTTGTQNFTASVDAGKTATVYDTNLVTRDFVAGSITSYVKLFGDGYDFQEDDEIDFAWANTDNRTYGITVAWRPL